MFQQVKKLHYFCYLEELPAEKKIEHVVNDRVIIQP